MVALENLLSFLLLLPFSIATQSSQQCDKDSCDDSPETAKCVNFDFTSFNENSPSIIYGEARGRFGNQFLAYMVFHQLKHQLGVDTYIDSTCRYVLPIFQKVYLLFTNVIRRYMLEFFTPECVQLPILSETYCNAEEIQAKLEPYNGPFKDLIND